MELTIGPICHEIVFNLNERRLFCNHWVNVLQWHPEFTKHGSDNINFKTKFNEFDTTEYFYECDSLDGSFLIDNLVVELTW